MTRCKEKDGLFGRCKLEHLHPGDHDNGKKTWPLSRYEVSFRAQVQMATDRLRAERRQEEEAYQRFQQERSPGP